MKKRILLPFIIAGGMVLSSCSEDLAINYSKGDQVIDTDWTDYSITPTGVKFASGEENLYIEKGQNHTYNYSITPKGATSGSLVWESGDDNIAQVENGVVSAVNGGTTYISVSEANGAFDPIRLTVHVTVALKSFDITPETTELDWNHSYTLTPTYVPADTTYRELIWSIPESEQDIATVSGGAIHTSNKAGTVHLTVTSGQLSGFSKQIEFHVADRKIHVGSINLALDTGEPDEVEIGHYTKVVATINPETADDRDQLQYFSREPDIASVDPLTGQVTAIKEGVAHIFANCEGVDSNDVTINVFEVSAREVHIDKSHDIEVTNDENGDAQLSISYVTNKMGYDTPSVATPTFTSSDRSVATVNSDGVIHAVSTGTATITVSIDTDLGTPATDTIEISSKVYGTAVVISGEHKAYLDETVTLTAAVTPESSVDDVVTWSIDPETRATKEVNGNSITLTPTEEGPLTVTATSEHNHVSATHVVSFNERKIEFETGSYYVVGSKQFNTGTSTSGVASWMNAKYALKLSFDSDNTDTSFVQYKGRVYFTAGDEWKIRTAGDQTGWKDMFSDDSGERVWFYEQAGAIDGVHLRADSSNKGGNITVLKEGSYDVYYKDYISGEKAGQYRIYVGHTPTISFDKTELTMGIGSSTTITLHNYAESVSSCVSSDPSVTVSAGTQTDHGMEYTVTGVSVGGATITATDSAGKSATCHVTVKSGATGVSRPIYLNAYGIFDADGAVPFVHAYNSVTTEHENLIMTPVFGQDIIYTADIDENFDSAIFVRMPEGSTVLDDTTWSSCYNETKADNAAFGDNDMFTVGGYDNDSSLGKKNVYGTWGTYDSEVHYKVPADYFLIGSFNNWAAQDENYAMTKINNNHYQITDVTFAVGDLLKVYSRDGKYLSNAEIYPGCHYELVDDGYNGYNLSIDFASTYTVDYYLDNSLNPIKLTAEGETPVDPPSEVKYYLKGTFNNWTEDDDYLLTKVTDNKYTIEGVEIGAGEKLQVFKPDDGEGVWYTSKNPWEGCGFSNDDDYNVVVTDAGTYTIDFYVVGDNENHIVITKTSGGGDTPVQTDVTYTLTIPDWSGNNDCVLFAWVWAPNFTSQWVQITFSGTSGSFTVSKELTGFKVVRCIAGTTEPNWDETGDVAGRIYNQTGDITCQAGVYSYTVEY